MTAHPDSLPDDAPGAAQRRWISAAMDGDAAALDAACRAWRDDPAAQDTWHAYHLIGDALRSRELVTPPSRDAAFLEGLREKLAAEPVVLAPTARVRVPEPAVRSRPARWLVPAAAAAGFAVVAGALVVLRATAPAGEGGPLIAGSPAPAAGGVVPVGEMRVIRDAQLDEYLRLHQAARGSVGAAVPGSVLRRVEAELPAAPAR